jgi:catechol 2,3-dioxygenase-like lactoylglutathione lyase family enzyme
MVNIERLNHAVLYVGHLDRATTFYSEILGFSVVVHYDEMRATFLRASESTNHHDLGLFEANDPQPPKQGSIGLYRCTPATDGCRGPYWGKRPWSH